jgi:hypothetical protein
MRIGKVPPNKAANNPFKNGKEKYLTDPVFLIGNGKSRQHFDLERLRSIGTIIGCNALYREFNPDILIAIDSKMLNEITRAKYSSEGTMIITPHNRSVNVPNAFRYKTGRFNTSGAFAMLLIKECMKPKRCYMLGMDAYPGNVYDGSKNYAVHTLKNFNGIHRFYLEILRKSGETVFINVNEKDGWPAEAVNTDKYSHMTYELFEKIVL